MSKRLYVSEQFFSIQGEGKTVGIPSYFLRLSGCNLLCGGRNNDGSTWICDSIDVWKKGEPKNYKEIISDFGADFLSNIKKGAHLVITGGEPMLQQKALNHFLIQLRKDCPDAFVEVESNATVKVNEDIKENIDLFNFSPKLKNSGENVFKRIYPAVLQDKYSSKIFKFVVSCESDVHEVFSYFINPFGLSKKEVYLMPAADNKKDLENLSLKIIDLCKKYSLNYSHRLHLSVWDKKTGV